MNGMHDFILIEGLKIDTVVGCFNWERQILQPLLVDLKLWLDLSVAAASDDLQDTLNYAEICQLASTCIQQAKPQLIEHAAQLILHCLFTQYVKIDKINIIIRKPAIIPAAQSVGIQLERQRDYFCNRYL